MSVEFRGFENVAEMLDNIVEKQELVKRMKRACAAVERTAKETAPKGDGELRRSITSKVETEAQEVVGVVYTPLEYAPYVEYGTGLFREQNPVAGYWIYVKDGGGGDTSRTDNSTKRYTLEEAKRIVAMMRDEGIEAVYTQGRHPHPYMRPALNANREKILEILGRANE